MRTIAIGLITAISLSAALLVSLATSADNVITLEKTHPAKLDIHIMSKCPFAYQLLDGVIPITEGLGERLDLRLHYIGKETDGELTSMHGKQELAGNSLQLCAHKHGSKKAWLDFMTCQREDWRNIPEGWETCARQAGLPLKPLRRCYSGPQGKQLLKRSFALSVKQEAKGCPTIFLNGERYNGGRSEQAIARAVCAQLKSPVPEYCSTIPAPVRMSVTVIADERCTDRGCDPTRFLKLIRHTFEGAAIEELDYANPRARALFEQSGQQYLPIAVFGPEVKNEEIGYQRLQSRLEPMPGGDDLVYPLGRNWNPTAEICDDEIDNTGNGKIDCSDDQCMEKRVCRPEIPRKLDLFMMSQCPYAAKILIELNEMLAAFGNDPRQIELELNYIGREDDAGLHSLHGPEEVEENKRQLCAQRYYRDHFLSMKYVVCRARNYRSSDWRACVPKGMSSYEIQHCASAKEGEELLRRSFDKASKLDITGSPSWLLNNRHEMRGRDQKAITAAYCERNPDVRGCGH